MSTVADHLAVPASGSAEGAGRRWAILGVVLAGAFMTLLGAAIVNVAIPSIMTNLHATYAQIGLVVTSYTLTYACFLLAGGRLGDLFGRKRLFIAGLSLFTFAAAACGMAPSITILIAARALQGVGGALLYPQVLSTIQVAFEGNERTQALGVFGAVLGLAFAAGQTVGGVLISADLFHAAWRPIFLINLPIGVATVLVAAVVLPHDRGERGSSLDGAGVVAVASGVFLLTVPLLVGRQYGWPWWTIVSLVLALPSWLLFVMIERIVAKRGRAPLVRLELFRHPGVAGGVPIAALFMFAFGGFFFVLAVYLQTGLGQSPLAAGLTYAGSGVGFFVMSLVAPRLVPFMGRYVLSVGYVLTAIGLLGTAALAAAAGTRVTGWELAPFLFLAGAGQGLGMTPLVGTIVAGLAPSDAGAASGVVTTTLQVGNALGVAVISLLFFGIAGDVTTRDSVVSAFAFLLPIVASLFLVAALLVRRLPRGPQFANALIEQQPSWAHALAYSMFLMTGGRIGDRLFDEILGRVTGRRLLQVDEAPPTFGEYLAYHFREAEADQAWVNYLIREALVSGNGAIPREEERREIMRRQVDAVRERQRQGTVDSRLDPALVRLFGLAVTNYPRVLPQITRLVTGRSVDDPQFERSWSSFLREIGRRLG